MTWLILFLEQTNLIKRFGKIPALTSLRLIFEFEWIAQKDSFKMMAIYHVSAFNFCVIDLMHNYVILWSRRLKSFENGYS